VSVTRQPLETNGKSDRDFTILARDRRIAWIGECRSFGPKRMVDPRNTALIDLAESLADNAAPEPPQRWILGVGAALLIGSYGLYCAVTRHAWVPRTRPIGMHEWHGVDAVAIGCALLFLAAFAHCHWFWSSHPRWHGYGQLGKLVAIIGIIASLAWLLYRQVG
jgi:hypothetical protein